MRLSIDFLFERFSYMFALLLLNDIFSHSMQVIYDYKDSKRWFKKIFPIRNILREQFYKNVDI